MQLRQVSANQGHITLMDNCTNVRYLCIRLGLSKGLDIERLQISRNPVHALHIVGTYTCSTAGTFRSAIPNR
jgi:hypothetical protein